MKFTIDAEFVETLYRKRRVTVEADSTSQALELVKRGMYNEGEILEEQTVDCFQQDTTMEQPQIISVEGERK